LAADHIIQPGEPHIGDPWFILIDL